MRELHYRITKHATTGLSPNEVLFGCNPLVLQIANLPGPVVSDLAEHSAALKIKLWVLIELVEANNVHSGEWQGFLYNSSTPQRLKVNQQVLLNNPPCWAEPWTVQRMRGPTRSSKQLITPSTLIMYVLCCLKKMKIIQPFQIRLYPYSIMRSFHYSQASIW